MNLAFNEIDSIVALEIANFSIEELFRTDAVEMYEADCAEASTHSSDASSNFENNDRQKRSAPFEEENNVARQLNEKKGKNSLRQYPTKSRSINVGRKNGERRKNGKEKATFQAKKQNKNTSVALKSFELHL